MKKLSEDQIQDMIGRKEKIRFVFMIAAFVAIVVNAFYFYELHKLGGEKTLLLKSIEVFNILLSLGVYALIIGYLRNNVTEVSYFLWYMDAFLTFKGHWEYGKKPFMFVKQWRMYSSFDELSAEVDKLRRCYSKYTHWAVISALALLPVLLCNSLEVLFSGESARIMMVWTDDVAFYLFFIPKCVFALLLAFSLFMFVYYKDRLRTLANDSSKCKVMATDISDFVWWFTSNLYMVASFFIKKKSWTPFGIQLYIWVWLLLTNCYLLSYLVSLP